MNEKDLTSKDEIMRELAATRALENFDAEDTRRADALFYKDVLEMVTCPAAQIVYIKEYHYQKKQLREL